MNMVQICHKVLLGKIYKLVEKRNLRKKKREKTFSLAAFFTNVISTAFFFQPQFFFNRTARNEMSFKGEP